MRRVDGRIDWLQAFGAALITGAGYFLLGYGSILISGRQHMISLIWPATAFTVCMIVRLSRSRRQDLLMLAAAFLAHAALNVAVGAPPMIIVGFGLLGLMEAVGAVVAVRLYEPRRFGDLRGNLRFLLAAVIAPPLVAASLAAIVMALAGNTAWQTDAQRWFAANALGLCILLPIGLSASWRKIAKLKLRERAGEAAIVFLALALVSLYTLRWAAHPMPFIILPIALAATVRFRLLGAGMTMLLVLVIALTSNLHAQTPDAYALNIETMQMFLAVTSLICTRSATRVERARPASGLYRTAQAARASAPRASRASSFPMSARKRAAPCRRSSGFPRCWNPASWRPTGPRNSPMSWRIMANCCSGSMPICSISPAPKPARSRFNRKKSASARRSRPASAPSGWTRPWAANRC